MDATIWDQILTRIETKVNRHSFYTWFKPTAFVADGGGAITVRVPNSLFKDWLTKHYSLVLAEALAEVRRILDWDWTGAEATYRAALAANPNSEAANRYYGSFMAARGRPEAAAMLDRACSLDPLCLVISTAAASSR